jgi:TRAP-type uncharacterized transport system substrate-binding protein
MFSSFEGNLYMIRQRYNAKIQRAKGLPEFAAAMYETSLSFQTTRAAERVLQTESRIAYALCEAIEKRRKLIPSDNFKPIDMRQLCANDEEAPFDIPLHPGARRFYRERGYLK